MKDEMMVNTGDLWGGYAKITCENINDNKAYYLIIECENEIVKSEISSLVYDAMAAMQEVIDLDNGGYDDY